MKKFSIITLLLLVTLCQVSLAKKISSTPVLERVERTPPVEGESKIEAKLTYKDTLIAISWNPDTNGFYFELTNLSPTMLEVLWTECYLTVAATNYTIVHGGIRDVREMPPSDVSPNGKKSDFLYPAAFARYERGRYTEMRLKPLFKKKVKEAADFVPEEFIAFLTLTAGGNRYTYSFYFKSQLQEQE